MDRHTIALVQESWVKVAPISATAGTLLYSKLFAADPDLRALFKDDREQQAAKLTQTVGAAVSKLNDLDFLVPVLQQLGQRHTGSGVLPAHHDAPLASSRGELLEQPEQVLWGGLFNRSKRQPCLPVEQEDLRRVCARTGRHAAQEFRQAVDILHPRGSGSPKAVTTESAKPGAQGLGVVSQRIDRQAEQLRVA